jgi:hypothetical protein
LKTISNRWENAVPSANGAQNYLVPGSGLGPPNIDGNREVLLDEISNVVPLRATAQKILIW